nr:sentrin-specific protease 6-like [Dermatophagoides farinae]
MSNGLLGNRSFSMINNEIDDSSLRKMTIFELKLRTNRIYIGETNNEISDVQILPDRIVLNRIRLKTGPGEYNITLPYVEMKAIRYCFCSDVSAIFIQPIFESFLKLSEWTRKAGANNAPIQSLKRSVPENFVMINLQADIDPIHLSEFRTAAKECHRDLQVFEINITHATKYLNQPNKLFQSNQIRTSSSSYNHFKRKKDDKLEEVIDIDDEDEEKHGDIQTQDKSKYKNNILDQAILKYPNDEDFKPIILYGNDLKCLRDGQYLNDNIMNFYLKYYQINGQIPQEIVDKIHIFDALFATHLLTVNNKRQYKYMENSKTFVNNTNDILENSYHKKLKKWTKDIDIFSKDFLLIPLVIKGHWFLIILCYIGNVIGNANNSANTASSVMRITRQQNDVATKRPTFIVMDSIDCKIKRNEIFSYLLGFLRLELKEKRSLEFSSIEWSNFRSISANVPQQQNTYDCGLFVLEYIERFLKAPEDIYNKLLQDKSSLHDWFESETLHHKRAKIQQIILNMLPPDDAKNLEDQLTRIQLRCMRNGVI